MIKDNDTLLEKVLSGAELTSDQQAQLSVEEQECWDIVQATMAIDACDDPPSHIDAAISRFARDAGKPGVRPLVVYFRLALTAAASLLFTLIVIQLLPIKKAESPSSAGINKHRVQQGLPDRSRAVDHNVKPTIAKVDGVPDFSWDIDAITKELSILDAEIYMEELDFADAALVENFE
ncbi:hypothetical protein BVX99_03150 [bacterium F16]|nr:hypothetical protein BVX99_03150 [bacterium F16]